VGHIIDNMDFVLNNITSLIQGTIDKS